MEEKPLFSTKEEQEKAIAYLKSLQEVMGWKHVVAPILKANIAETERQLQNSNFKDLTEVKRIQDRIAYQRSLLELPKRFIRQLRAAEGGPVSFDPYDKEGEVAEDSEVEETETED